MLQPGGPKESDMPERFIHGAGRVLITQEGDGLQERCESRCRRTGRKRTDGRAARPTRGPREGVSHEKPKTRRENCSGETCQEGKRQARMCAVIFSWSF